MAGFALRDATVGIDGEAALLAVQLAVARLLPPPRARTSVQLLEGQGERPGTDITDI